MVTRTLKLILPQSARMGTAKLVFVVTVPVPVPEFSALWRHKHWGKRCFLPTVGWSWGRLP